jgi:hypothetical protein
MAMLADPARSWAVLIGVPDYQTLPALPSVAANVARLGALLTDPAIWGLPTEQCLVPDVTATQPLDAAMAAIQTAARQATDTILVYYAGHGLADPISGALYLTLPDAEDLRYSYRALAFDHIRRTLGTPGLPAARRVVILDCCFSALALDGEMSAAAERTGMADLADVSGAYVFTACAETEAALAPPGETYTAFTGELIATLENGIPDGPELLDLNTLYRHLTRVLGTRRRPVPQQRSRNLAGDLALARNRAWLPDATPAAKTPVRADGGTDDRSANLVQAGRQGPAVPITDQAVLLRRLGQFDEAAAVLRQGAVSREPESVRKYLLQLRRANRHREAAEMLRLVSDR